MTMLCGAKEVAWATGPGDVLCPTCTWLERRTPTVDPILFAGHRLTSSTYGPCACAGLPCPWEMAEERDVSIFLGDLPPGHFGLTDGVDRIWLDRQLSHPEARATLMHELVHIERRHIGAQSEEVEAAVDEEAARRLMPDPALVDAALLLATHNPDPVKWWSDEDPIHECAARLLAVDGRMVRARLATLREMCGRP